MKYRFGPQLATALRVRGLTARAVADAAQVAPATLASALHGREVQMRTALRIARVVADTPVIPELDELSRGLGDE